MHFEDYHMPDDVTDDPEARRVFDIYKQVMPDAPDSVEILFDHFEAGQEVFVARDDDTDEVVGVASYYLPKGTDYAFLSGIAVDPDQRGARLIGPAMMDYLFARVSGSGRHAIEGITLPQSRSFYQRLGGYAVDGDRLRLDIPSDN